MPYKIEDFSVERNHILDFRKFSTSLGQSYSPFSLKGIKLVHISSGAFIGF
jgi:hypothetical protein